ncbi:hypothetical protein [Mycoplasma wenyonii]|nr:hypothetical protein [Mycoplasma wenyonii]
MIWKKLLLELVAVSGLGGGIGGWFNVFGGGHSNQFKRWSYSFWS